MRVDVVEVVDQPDGSARVTIDLDGEALSLIIEMFIAEVLTEQFEFYRRKSEES